MEEKFNAEKSPETMAYVLKRDAHTKRCNMCCMPVLKSDLKDRPYQCMFCDVDLSDAETHEGKIHTDKEFNDLCCQTRDILLLDD